jgi:hypothetical protein
MSILQLLAPSKETEMRKHVLILTTTAAILACGTIAASAQTGAQTDTQQSPITQPTPGSPTTQHQDTVIHGVQPAEDDDDQNGLYGYGGMFGPGMTSGGIMGRRWRHDCYRGRAMMAPVMMRIIFSLMDADGDGKLTLQEFQAAHERIFKAMDTDHDGTVTLEEMQAFMRGASKPTAQ